MDLTNAHIQTLSIHYTGNKTNDQELVLSGEPLFPDPDLAERLNTYFLKKFPSVYETYHFHHPSGLRFHEMYHFVCDLFEKELSFHEVSRQIAAHLYNNALHPNIKPGELYICLFEGCIPAEGASPVEAVGFFKTESKHEFLNISRRGSDFEVGYQEGIDLHKLDKGCLVFNTGREEGFLVSIVDSQNRGEEAIYWKEHFLGLEQTRNDYHQTNQFLGIAKNFVTKQLDTEFEVQKSDKIDLLNRSVAYFKTHETFSKDEFENTVFQAPEVIESFRQFEQSMRDDQQQPLPDQFEISPQAVKKQSKVFKSVLKLDKNFHIYIHGDKNLIEQGIDSDGRKFYKIYYKEEN